MDKNNHEPTSIGEILSRNTLQSHRQSSSVNAPGKWKTDLTAKFPTPQQFMNAYNPSEGARIVRSAATQGELALDPEIPSLGLLDSTFGSKTLVTWLMVQFNSINEFAEAKTKMSDAQLLELSRLVAAEYYYLNAAEIVLFVARFKMGMYGEFYGAIDALKITSALRRYVAERRADIERLERELYKKRRAQLLEERSASSVTYEQYLELKSRAENGDEEAREMLYLNH